MKIAAVLLCNLLDFATDRGMDVHALKAILNNSEQNLKEDGATVTKEEYLDVLAEVVYSEQDAHLGLSFGIYLNLSALGIIHSISLTTTSIAQAFLLLENYLKTNFPLLELELDETKTTQYLVLHCNVEDERLRNCILDSSFVFIYRELSMMLGEEHVNGYLPYEDMSLFEQRLSTELKQSKRHSFRVDKKLVAGNINKKNLTRIELLLPKYMELLENGGLDKDSFVHRTRNMILKICDPQLPDLQQVCSQFAMSDRTFQRRLKAEGYSFRAITNEIKKQIAEYLQKGNSLKTQDIAYLLGYSEPSAYLHAAKKW